jgi:hypothetical protein
MLGVGAVRRMPLPEAIFGRGRKIVVTILPVRGSRAVIR